MVRWSPALLAACGAPAYVPKEPPFVGAFSDTAADTASDTATSDTAASDPTCSGYGSAPVALIVDNRHGVGVGLYWIGFDCVEIGYGAIDAGGSVVQASFDTHAWVVREQGTGALLASIVLDDTPEQHLEVR